MLIEQPTWTYKSGRSLCQWYGHVQLVAHKVLGQWVCLDLYSGQRLWQRRYRRPNTVVGVGKEVIVATEMRSDGSWTLTFGCYGISLETGVLLWTSHATRPWSWFLRCFDFVPRFTNSLRDAAVGVRGSRCVCESGRVLDIRSGREVGRTRDVEAWRPVSLGDSDKQSPAERLYYSQLGGEPSLVEIGEGKFLTHRWDGESPPSEPLGQQFQLFLVKDRQHLQWRFGIGDSGKYIDGNYFSYRYAGDCVYMLVSDEPQFQPVGSMKALSVKPNATKFQIWTLDLGTGTIVQKIPVTDGNVLNCRIEDINDGHLLISIEGKTLLCYQRRSRSSA